MEMNDQPKRRGRPPKVRIEDPSQDLAPDVPTLEPDAKHNCITHATKLRSYWRKDGKHVAVMECKVCGVCWETEV